MNLSKELSRLKTAKMLDKIEDEINDIRFVTVTFGLRARLRVLFTGKTAIRVNVEIVEEL